AKVYGVEYDADLKLGKVTISTAGAYNRARLDGNFCNFKADPATLTIAADPTCSSGIAAASGTRLPRQPEFKGNTSIRYDTEYGDYRVY
ncbi:hypothetical protein ACNI5A_30785, partial [Klebsiella pneumoniae]|uniref:hypothetical protein n=1 Tax=Klebsiella pneumoniae TaxID=573 RepID=UPI003A889E34